MNANLSESLFSNLILEMIIKQSGCLTNRKMKRTGLTATFQIYTANQTDAHNVPLRDVVTDPRNQPEKEKDLP